MTYKHLHTYIEEIDKILKDIKQEEKFSGKMCWLFEKMSLVANDAADLSEKLDAGNF